MSSLEISNVIPLERPTLHSEKETEDQYLRKLVEQVRSHSRSSTKSIIAIGKALLDAKQRLGHGKFVGWVKAECGFTIRAAQNYMRAAELTDKSEIVSHLNPAAIYRLAKASTPPDVVDRVVELLDAGEVPTEQQILGLIPSDSKGQESPMDIAANAALNLARELHACLGDALVSQLLASRWPDVRKHLRDVIEQSGGALKTQDRQATAASSRVETALVNLESSK
jgi:hypothetical protein